jgi:hypothetical protein
MTQEGLAAIFEIALLIGSTKGLKNANSLSLLPGSLAPSPPSIPCLGCRSTTRKSERRYLTGCIRRRSCRISGGVCGGKRKEGGREKGEGGREKMKEELADIIDGDEEREED